jgi:hypothetical protein
MSLSTIAAALQKEMNASIAVVATSTFVAGRIVLAVDGSFEIEDIRGWGLPRARKLRNSTYLEYIRKS